jgi:hypothetical protein
MCKRNKTDLWYSLYKESEVVYLTDENGDIIYQEIDGEEVPIETGHKAPHYEKPVSFKGYIQYRGGISEAEPYGVNLDYTHMLIMRDGELPIDETSLIYTKEPKMVSEETADFKVIGVANSLNFVTYLLKSNV